MYYKIKKEILKKDNRSFTRITVPVMLREFSYVIELITRQYEFSDFWFRGCFFFCDARCQFLLLVNVDIILLLVIYRYKIMQISVNVNSVHHIHNIYVQ